MIMSEALSPRSTVAAVRKTIVGMKSAWQDSAVVQTTSAADACDVYARAGAPVACATEEAGLDDVPMDAIMLPDFSIPSSWGEVGLAELTKNG